jgi:dolichol-phosphate mannosyltransferase
LVRYAASRGAKVGFLDGAKVLKVRMYEGMKETWEEWGRSLDLKDAATAGQVWGDLWLLFAVQGLPLVMLLIAGVLVTNGNTTLPALITLGLNGFLVAIRIALNWAIAPSYDLSQASSRWIFWLSPLADPFAVLRILLSSTQTPTSWRGRTYSA